MPSRAYWLLLSLAACVHAQPTVAVKPMVANVQPGACADPAHDGVLGPGAQVEHADRDLNGDGTLELVVVDRKRCTAEGNCFWNVFAPPHAAGDCARYLGTLEGAWLEQLASTGDDRMVDVRAYYKLHGGRLLLQSYHFTRGGYRITDVLQCKHAADDRLECADTDR